MSYDYLLLIIYLWKYTFAILIATFPTTLSLFFDQLYLYILYFLTIRFLIVLNLGDFTVHFVPIAVQGVLAPLVLPFQNKLPSDISTSKHS